MKLKELFEAGSNDMEIVPIAPIGEVVVDEEEKASLPNELPILALKNTVMFPYIVLPINAGREKSIKAIRYALKTNSLIGVVAQKDRNVDEPSAKDLNRTGTVAKVIKEIKLPDGNSTAFIMGRVRFKIDKFVKSSPFLKAKVSYLFDEEPDEKKDKHFKAQVSTIKELAEKLITLSHNMPSEAVLMLRNVDSNEFLINYLCSNIEISVKEKQELLEENELKVRADKLISLMHNELQLVELKNEIAAKTRGEMDRQQREYFLQQQLKSIKDELDGDHANPELNELRVRASTKQWPKNAQDAFDQGYQRLEKMHPHAPDYSINFNHLKLLTELPWDECSSSEFNLKKAVKVLDKDHYGLEKIKKRIVEYLAVLKLKGDLKSPILCFVGPPGIGKTSLGQSIAKAVGREYVRISLGGLSDESELRGHRKTYLGAMPGRIIKSIKKAKTSNPVFILDEIEKMGKDFKGDPSSALLEILDPEQNHAFYDNYLETEYDLSKVMFIATANSISEIQPALRDRMEIIQLSGYSVEEKVEIAKKHLLPKQIELHGLDKKSVSINKTVLKELIHNYTRESGVRELNRVLAGVMRFVAKKIVMEEEVPSSITSPILIEALGKPKYDYDKYQVDNPPGVAVGLAWTSVGGDILFIESSLSKGKGTLQLTGNLGDVMKESAQTALSYLKSNAAKYDIDETIFEQKNVHIHVPEGAIPKDGPSAGITMLTALVSTFKGQAVQRHIAMSGEITLRGQVLPVGGIKEKVLAAKRAGLKHIILSEENRKDVEEINAAFIKGLKFTFVKTMDEVIEHAI